MNALFLDLASYAGLLACVTEKEVIASEPVDHRIGDHELVPLLEAVLGRAKWSYRDLTHVACVIGPGGFTSLRVAVALANTLVHQLKIPGTGVHLSDLSFARISPHPAQSHGVRERRWQGATLSHQMGEGRVRDVLWIHSTKKHELFVRGFGEYAKQWPEAAHSTIEDFLAKLSSTLSLRDIPPPGEEGIRRTLFWVGELIPEHEKVLAERELVPAPLQLLQDVLPDFLVRQTFMNSLLVPWYGREG